MTRFLLVVIFCYGQVAWACGEHLSQAQMSAIGHQIFMNECGGHEKCLVHWNEGEAFPSLGIGHFIWYPEDVESGFVESFPLLIAYMKYTGIVLPDWLIAIEPFDAPWTTREEFVNNTEQRVVQQLRQFLQSHMAEQTAFLNHRMQQSLSMITQGVGRALSEKMNSAIQSLCKTPSGVYSLIDYVNFKGEGLSPKETYGGEGWGLKQVLMDLAQSNEYPIEDSVLAFAESAKRVLTARANRSGKPAERDVWLPVWLKRIDTYTSY